MTKRDIRKEKRENGSIIPLYFDFEFTGIFGNPNNIDIIEYFLSDYLNESIEDIVGNVEILPRDLDVESKSEKSKQVDLILKLGDRKINIEISTSGTQGKIERDIVYAARIHGGQLKYAEKDYNNIGRTIQIRINNYACNKKNLIETNYLRNSQGKILSKKFRIDNVDLAKASQNSYNENEKKLSKWCKVLIAKTRDELEKELGDKLMSKEAREKLIDEVDKYSRDEECVALYSKYTREELERNTFISETTAKIKAKLEAESKKEQEKAIKEMADKVTKEVTDKVTKEVTDKVTKEVTNKVTKEVTNKVTKEVTNKVTKEVTDKVRKKQQLEMARKMLKDKLSIDNIMKYTNLTKKEIENIK